MNILVFEDSHVSKLHPVTLGRAAYAITCASYRLIDLLAMIGAPTIVGHVRQHLQTIQSLDFPELATELDKDQQYTLLVNARLAPTRTNLNRLKEVFAASKPAVHCDDGQLAFAVVETQTLDGNVLEKIDSLLNDAPSNDEDAKCLFHFPHDVIGANMNAFNENMQLRLTSGSYTEIADGVFSTEGTSLPQDVAFDSGPGPIVFESSVSFGPYSFIRGPVYIGPNCKVNEHSAIKDAVSLSHTIKIGGEVEGVVIEAYSNKQHLGFLGHSYLGSWINLGAGTCNSDLKNTYGLVNVQYGSEKISSGMQFVGCAIGDYTKTAINTSIFTGKMIGAGSMLYGFVTSNVPSFVNYAKSFDQMSVQPAEVLITTQKRMFARRKVEHRLADIQLVKDMFELTKHERPELSADPLAF